MADGSRRTSSFQHFNPSESVGTRPLGREGVRGINDREFRQRNRGVLNLLKIDKNFISSVATRRITHFSNVAFDTIRSNEDF